MDFFDVWLKIELVLKHKRKRQLFTGFILLQDIFNDLVSHKNPQELRPTCDVTITIRFTVDKHNNCFNVDLFFIF